MCDSFWFNAVKLWQWTAVTMKYSDPIKKKTPGVFLWHKHKQLWLVISARTQFKTLVLAYGAVHQHAPTHLQSVARFQHSRLSLHRLQVGSPVRHYVGSECGSSHPCRHDDALKPL